MDHSIEIAFADQVAPHIVDDYFVKRDAWFKKRLSRPDYPTKKDVFDALSGIVIATDGSVCLGGIRCMLRRPTETHPLSTEAVWGGVTWYDNFPDLHLERVVHVELSKMFVCNSHLSQMMQNKIAYRMLHFLLSHNQQYQVEYVLFCTWQAQARRFEMLARFFNLPYESKINETALTSEAYRMLGQQFIQAVCVKNWKPQNIS